MDKHITVVEEPNPVLAILKALSRQLASKNVRPTADTKSLTGLPFESYMPFWQTRPEQLTKHWSDLFMYPTSLYRIPQNQIETVYYDAASVANTVNNILSLPKTHLALALKLLSYENDNHGWVTWLGWTCQSIDQDLVDASGQLSLLGEEILEAMPYIEKYTTDVKPTWSAMFHNFSDWYKKHTQLVVEPKLDIPNL